MASTIQFQCKCGEVYHVFIPKSVLFSETLPDAAKNMQRWEETDRKEESDGEIELAQQYAQKADAHFVDWRLTPIIICNKCSTIHDPLNDIKRQANKIGEVMMLPHQIEIFEKAVEEGMQKPTEREMAEVRKHLVFESQEERDDWEKQSIKVQRGILITEVAKKYLEYLGYIFEYDFSVDGEITVKMKRTR